jgi:hypothetical protein
MKTAQRQIEFGEALDVGPYYVQFSGKFPMSCPNRVPILVGTPQADKILKEPCSKPNQKGRLKVPVCCSVRDCGSLGTRLWGLLINLTVEGAFRAAADRSGDAAHEEEARGTGWRHDRRCRRHLRLWRSKIDLRRIKQRFLGARLAACAAE